MSKSKIDQLTTWLNDAYSMEQSLAQALENHAKDAEDFPEIQRHLEQHIDETRRHADRVKYCLSLLGETPSTAKSVIGNVSGMLHGASTGMYSDELVKNALADFASENFEIACYRSLIAAAQEVNRPEIADVCREILQDEEAMAEWLETQIPQITQTFLRLEKAKA